MSKAKILIVDDEREFATTLAQRLCLRGYDARVIFSVDDTLPVVESMKPDVILLDLKMPGISGIEILMTVRNLSPGTEVILLTGHLDLAKSIEGMRLDSFNIIIKPFDINELIAKIEHTEGNHV